MIVRALYCKELRGSHSGVDEDAGLVCYELCAVCLPFLSYLLNYHVLGIFNEGG